MRGFIPYSNSDGRVQPWEYLPAAGSTAPGIGLALVLSAGKLVKASGATRPAYICMREEAAAVAAGTLIPVIRVEPDQVFECVSSEGLSGVEIGAKVTIASDGLRVTASTTDGVAAIVDKDGDEAGSRVLVRFE